jgi:hypothetical protein
LVGNPSKDRLLGRDRCRWKDNIKTDFKETGLIWLQNEDEEWALVNIIQKLGFHRRWGVSRFSERFLAPQ